LCVTRLDAALQDAAVQTGVRLQPLLEFSAGHASDDFFHHP
jgi:hypothetical protein